MLCFSRRTNEAIWIGQDVRILVLEVRSGEGKVRVGIDAPRDVAVHREEVFEAIQAAGGDDRKLTQLASHSLKLDKQKSLIERLHKTALMCDPTYFGSHMFHEAEELCQ